PAAFCRNATTGIAAAARRGYRYYHRRAGVASSRRDVAARRARGALRAQSQGGRGPWTMTKRLGASVLLIALASASAAQAQSYPSRTITLTVTAAAGGVTDVVARALGERLSQRWGQQVVIENKGGAAHVVGAQSVAKAAPDGYSLLVAEAGTFTINP